MNNELNNNDNNNQFVNDNGNNINNNQNQIINDNSNINVNNNEINNSPVVENNTTDYYSGNNPNSGSNGTEPIIVTKNNNFLVNLFLIVFVILIGAGIVFYFQSSYNSALKSYGETDTEEETTEVENNSDNSTGEEETTTEEKKETRTTTLYPYSTYKNYKLAISGSYVDSGKTITYTGTGRVDLENNADYTVIRYVNKEEGLTASTYIYTDYNKHYLYTSYDQKTWTSTAIATNYDYAGLSQIIPKINSNSSDVIKKSDSHYLVTVDISADGASLTGVTADVYVSDGYVVKVTYDLSNYSKELGYSNYTFNFTTANINSSTRVTIPSSVTGSNT